MRHSTSTPEQHKSPANGQPDTEPEITRGSAASASGPDPFDPASYRLSGDLGASLGIAKVPLVVPVRKPDKAWFVRVHPDEAFRMPTAVIELKERRETYLVVPELWSELATEATFKPKLLATAISRQGEIFLWELNLPRPDGRDDTWSKTALEAMQMATTHWIRIVANMSLGAYDVFRANGQLTEPTWPKIAFRDILRLAFKDRLISSLDHPVLRQLRGEA